MTRWVLAITAFPIVLALLFGACFAWNAVMATSKADVERMLRENLPPGSTVEEVFRHLDDQDIGHGDIHSAGEYSSLVDAGVPRDAEVIGGIIRNASRDFPFTKHISFWLILDAERRVVDYHLEDGYDGF